MEEKMISRKEKLSFGLGMFGTNATYALVSFYMMVFFTDVLGISAAVAGSILLFSRIWDAVNDPMMGIIADHTNTRWGKFRPYLLFSGVLMAAFTVMLFTTPNISTKAKAVYAAVSYVAWSMAYTMSDIPKWSLISVMTNNTQERTSLISFSKIFGMFGMIGIPIIVIPLVNVFGKGNESLGYQRVAMLIGLIVLIASFIMFKNTEERIKSSKTTSLSKELSAVINNKPLLLVLISFVIGGSLLMITLTIQVYYIIYNLGSKNLIPITQMAAVIPMLLGILLVPILVKKMGKKNVYILAAGLSILRGIIFYFIGFNNTVVAISFIAINSMFFGMTNVLVTAIIADTIDYNHWKNGARSEGIIFSMQTFSAKLASAVAAGLSGYLLTFIKYVPNVDQTASTLKGLHILMTIVPTIGSLVSIIPMLFYKLTEKMHEDILSELKGRSNNRVNVKA